MFSRVHGGKHWVTKPIISTKVQCPVKHTQVHKIWPNVFIKSKECTEEEEGILAIFVQLVCEPGPQDSVKCNKVHWTIFLLLLLLALAAPFWIRSMIFFRSSCFYYRAECVCLITVVFFISSSFFSRLEDRKPSLSLFGLLTVASCCLSLFDPSRGRYLLVHSSWLLLLALLQFLLPHPRLVFRLLLFPETCCWFSIIY